MSVNFVKKTLSIGTLVSTLFLLVACGEPTTTINYDEFAQCLTDEGMALYGAFWCGHCAAQKEMFGESLEYINYYECDPRGENSQSDVCLDEEIMAYPTWKHPDGRFWEGVQSFEKLSQVSGCELPEEYYAEDSE